MSRKYKFNNPDGIYFITFSVVGWVDVFTRDIYRNILIESFNWCVDKKGLNIYAWVIMTNHVHLIIFRSGSYLLESIMRDMKKFTSIKILDAIKTSTLESRKEWMLRVFKEAGEENPQNINYQFWQHGNHPIELDNNKIIDQKLAYLHNNPVMQGCVNEVEHYNWSSAMDYAGLKGLVKLDLLQ